MKTIVLLVVLIAAEALDANAISVVSVTRSVLATAPPDTQQQITSTNLGGFNENIEVFWGSNSASASLDSSLSIYENALSFESKGSCGAVGDGSSYVGVSVSFDSTSPCQYFLSVDVESVWGFGYGRSAFSRTDTGGFDVIGPSSITESGILGANLTGQLQHYTLFVQIGFHEFTTPNFNAILSVVEIGTNTPPVSPKITRSPTGALSVVWPRAATNLVLEATTNLDSPVWVQDTNTVATSGAFFSVPVDTTQPARFFRMKYQ